ncbi:glycogen synthase (ADP-glucose) [Herbihabitans rhizosphaerae]|uniref:Glycogen synthase (ADP-glucose) n=1 Tax=Herbihabitans rhizosphaerae TaxID=1872711 RepID=A0A4V2EUE5_9PSEU|nr:glycogen synthase [Herbihabitans rhizosphaerae]RZS44293.1 glycogen synthase (ADP-glucose) [Herbihabitans rhizosphaerae]
MRIGLLTREYPPEVYGGAGVHVDHLVACLRELIEVEVHCFGSPRGAHGVHAHAADAALIDANAALRTLSVDLSITAATGDVDLVHSHTWYANLAGHLSHVLHGIPHVVTAHSLEPRRPWKAEQLGGGYRLSSWVERTALEAADAVIAVSEGMRADVLACYPTLDPARVHVVRNGIDTNAFHPVERTDVLRRLGIRPDLPIVLFVGRITRQKGLAHLIAAAHAVDPHAQVVLCAGAPDTEEIATSTSAAVSELAAARDGVFWVREMLPPEDLRQMLSAATVFVCPSVYEPLGIVNLEAMACGTAVVASDVGGIPEVVDDGVTGVLVPFDEHDPEGFAAGLASGVNSVLADRALAARMGEAGRSRAERDFAWTSVAEQTVRVYESVLRG